MAPQEMPERSDSSSKQRIVISGIAGLYPESRNVKDLSNILYNKINPIKVTKRWKYKHPELSPYTGNVPELQYFDAQFFKVHFRLGSSMDSMARKVLEQTYAAIYDAGISPEHLSGKRVGVYIGSCFSETEKACFYVASSRTGFGIAGCSKTMFANRISYWLNTKGPSMSIDNACCSSITALEVAYQDILHGVCEAAIVGGTNICLHPQSSIHFGRIMKLSMDGKTRSFDSNAAGFNRSEAINVLFLQKASDALRVYADIEHVKTEYSFKDNKSPKYGFYRNSEEVVNFLEKFYQEAKVIPQDVQYVEAFGSAVLEADKAELEAIDKVFCANRKKPLLVGSVTSNIGYGEAASGISAITKVILGYHKRELAANLHCDSPRQDVAAIREKRMQIVTNNYPFEGSYTAVNSLSVTGINAHILLKNTNKSKELTRYESPIPRLVLISARQHQDVKTVLDDLKSRPIDPEEIALLNNIHETKILGHLGRGYTILDTSEDNTVSLAEEVNYFDEAKRPLWFIYTGMGSQWPGMGEQLMRIPIFAAAVERCRRVLEPLGIDIVNILTSPDKKIFDNVLHSFVGIAAVQIGLTDILRAINIHPDKIIGHSVGELGCAYADGCFTTEEMILSAYSRGLVSIQTPFIRGSMAAVALGHEEVLKLCPPEIEVACHNGPDSSTISGPADIMKEFVAFLTSKHIFAKEVPCSNIAYHSRYIAEAGPKLLKCLSQVIKDPKARTERWVSTSVPQDRWSENAAKYSSAEYHTNNLLRPVLFDETSRLIPSNALTIEIAPHGLLQAILKRSLPTSCCHIPLTRRGHQDGVRFLLEAIGKLYMQGCLPKIKALYPKIEFPVSTGTPMLSHLVRWAHNEKWTLPLFDSANRRTAAACKYIINKHDDDYSYLKGHIIKGKTQYPFAAALVAVWDTLAMSLGIEPKKLSVQFQDVHFLSHLILQDHRPLHLNVTLQRGTGKFEVMEDIILVAKGFIFGEINKQIPGYDTTEDTKSARLNSTQIYELLKSRDYGYRDGFRSIVSTNVELTNAEIIWQNNWVTLIDGLFQFNVLKQDYSSVISPKFIKEIVIDVQKHETTKTRIVDQTVVMEANIANYRESTSCGGITLQTIQYTELLPVEENVWSMDKGLAVSYKEIQERNGAVDKDKMKSSVGVILKSGPTGDINSLRWVDSLEPTGPGIIVHINYSGINTNIVKKYTKIRKPYKLYNQFELPVIDFSGTTKSGHRVMGVTQTANVASCLNVNPDLMWPVPAHWTLEEAATVPLAYSMAYYILCIKSNLLSEHSILVHGGTGALGQAIISIALAIDCKVFVTVSDINKKQFLRKLFPKLKDDHIGNSRDITFCDMVRSITDGKCCDLAVICAKGELNESTYNCCGSMGVIIDAAVLHNTEDFDFGMHNLTKERSYVPVNFSSVFKSEYNKDMKQIRELVSEGIARGHVRPLTRTTFGLSDVSRAYKLVATSRHRGRVLLDFQRASNNVPRFLCTSQKYQAILSDDVIFGIKLIDKLINLGARKILLQLPKQSNLIALYSIFWEKCGVQTKISYGDVTNKTNVVNALKSSNCEETIENVFVILSKHCNNDVDKIVKSLSKEVLLLNNSLRHFIVLKTGDKTEDSTSLSTRKSDGIIHVTLPAVLKMDEKRFGFDTKVSINSVLNCLEKAICLEQTEATKYHKFLARAPTPLLQQLAEVTDINNFSNTISPETTLRELNTDLSKLDTIAAYLNNIHSIYIPKEYLPSLTLQQIENLEKYLSSMKHTNEPKRLESFFGCVESDELLATTEIIFLPTLSNQSTSRDDEFDVSQKYLCIVPGVEGLHLRFKELCEGLKLPALVLQPGLENPNESLRDVAERYASILLKKTEIKQNFYLLGYESGVMVALEMASILESKGLTGTVFCLGGSPAEIQAFFEDKLSEFDTYTALQLEIVRHMYKLFVNESTKDLDIALQTSKTWEERVNACLQCVHGRIMHSKQYAKDLINAAYARLLQVQRYKSQLAPLNSTLVAFCPRYSFNANVVSANLREFSQKPVISYQLEAPLAYAAQDLRCPAIINHRLDKDILEAYKKRNICETYLLNADTFMTSAKDNIE